MTDISETKSKGDPKGNIVIVDDTPGNLQVLSILLSHYDYEVRGVVSGAMALKTVQSAPPDLILLDIMMPEMDGYEVCKRLKATAQTAEIPIIFISALDEVFDKVKAFSLGGVDYITKPFQGEEVIARVQNQLNLQAAKAQISQLNAELELRVQQRTAQLEKEILERQLAQQQLLHMALHDTLTGLPNRSWFMERLGQVLSRVKQHVEGQFAVLYLDCDRFKFVNDSLGHLVGDQLLVAVARRLEGCLRHVNTLSRLGGDEFAIILEDIQDLSDAVRVAEQINTELGLVFSVDPYEVFINASVGIVLGDASYDKPEHLLRDADTAMYYAKFRGKARYQVFDQAMHTSAQSRLRLETDLRRAIKGQVISVHYQPIVSLKTLTITGFEALARWHHPDGHFVDPEEFIPIAEDTGLVVWIDLWVLRQACQHLSTWQAQHSAPQSFTISINLSANHFLDTQDTQLVEQIDQILLQTGLQGHHLRLEITETAFIGNPHTAASLLTSLRQRGIQLSIDDFGTGYSSLSYLHQFPVSTLKIDRSFVNQISTASKKGGIIPTIVTLAQQLGITIVAEGIETAQQLDYLKALGCEEGQGYFFARPLAMDAATAMVAQNPQW